MDNAQTSRTFFFAGGFLLILIVFVVTLAFSFFLPPVALSLPLLLAYYGFIWSSVFWYRKNLAKDEPVLKWSEFQPSFARLTRWMLVWTIGYPLLVGTICLLTVVPKLPWYWIAAGFFFALVNGPSEEIFWRLLMERAGKDGGVGPKTRLWFSSAVFSSWHFVFVVFLIPGDLLAGALVSTLGSTFVAGLLWMMVYQKTGNMFPLAASHAVLNFLVIFPSIATTVLGIAG